MKTFYHLKIFMRECRIEDVHDWNERRDQAKKLFPQKLINRLDMSGFIKSVVNQKSKHSDES
jgi:hypothetical protein